MPTSILTTGSPSNLPPLPPGCTYHTSRDPSADHILLLGPSDSLNPAALPALIRAAAASPSGAIGGFRFTSLIGDLPFPSLPLPSTLSLQHLLHLRPIPSAVLINRRALPRGATHDTAFGLILDLAQRAPFAHCPDTTIACRPLSPLTDIDPTLADLAAHIRLLADLNAPAIGDLPTIAADLIDAVIVLKAHQRTLANRGTSHLAAATRFPFLYAQWWHRCGLYGPAPRHILDANGGIAEAISTDPAHIARRLLSLCPGGGKGKTPILLGLGRNARALARLLHAAGRPVIGRDDSGTPAWAAEDHIPVQVLPTTDPFDPAATYIMTVFHDDAFMARLPQSLCVHRWRQAPDLILAEWRAAALDWALRTTDSGIAEPKPALAEVPA